MRDESAVRVFVLDYLRHGPVQLRHLVEDAWTQKRFPRLEVTGACERLGVLITGDKPFQVMLPDNIAAIWWAKRAPAHRFTGAARGGSAA